MIRFRASSTIWLVSDCRDKFDLLFLQMTICKNIVRGNILFPEYVTDPGAKDIIRLLLTKYVAVMINMNL